MKLSEIKTGDQLQMELIRQGWRKSIDGSHWEPVIPFFWFNENCGTVQSIDLYPAIPEKLSRPMEALGVELGYEGFVGALLDSEGVTSL